MTRTLQQWRRRNNLTQVEAAAVLGVSQTYLSLLEKGSRRLTGDLRGRLKAATQFPVLDSSDDIFRAKLSALGYPGFAHVPPKRSNTSPDVLLFTVLARPDADARVVEALPWLVRRYSGQMNMAWLVQQAKLKNLQNRLGFVLQTAGVKSPAVSTAVQELERARLLAPDTLCWNSIPVVTREWMLGRRSPEAAYWNLLTTLQPKGGDDGE